MAAHRQPNDESVKALRVAMGLGPGDPDIEQRKADPDDFVHRVVSVRSAEPLRVVGPSSAFGNVRLGGEPPAIDYDSLKTAGPVVPPPWRKGSRFNDLLERLQVNESRTLPLEDQKALRAAVKAWVRHKQPDKRFAIRRISDAEIGIWRLK